MLDKDNRHTGAKIIQQENVIFILKFDLEL